MVSGGIFALVFVLHIWRFAVEGTSVGADPFFVVSSAISFIMAVWAARLSFVRRGA